MPTDMGRSLRAAVDPSCGWGWLSMADTATPIVDDKVMAAVGGKNPLASDAEVDAAFEAFRVALRHAHWRGSISAMRAAVAAYDKFAHAIGAD